MSYVRSKMINGCGPYYYEVKSVREGKTVRQVHIRYIGTSPGGATQGLPESVVPNSSQVSKYIEKRVGKSGITPSKQETLGTEFRFNMGNINETSVQMALGEEKEIGRIKRSFSKYWKETDSTITFDTVFTETSQGAGRVVLFPVHAKSSYFKTDRDVDWRPSAGLVWRSMEGKRVVVDVMVEEDSQGKGLGTEAMKAMQEKYGQLYVIGPYSQQGAKLVGRFPDAIQLVSRKPA